MSAASMFDKPKRIRADTEALEIVYEVQWKTAGNDEDKEKIIGILETPDTNLDWNTFKSYLIQNSGNMRLSTDDIKICYIDSEDDIIPVDSELEFRECLKFSKARARRGRRVTLRVSAAAAQSPGAGARPKQRSEPPSAAALAGASGSQHGRHNIKLRLKKSDLMASLQARGKEEPPSEQDPAQPPGWFMCFMTQFKKELVEEITQAVMTNVKQQSVSSAAAGELPAAPSFPVAPQGPKYHRDHLGHLLDKRKKKKKISEEDSSDCTDGLPLQWEEKLELLRHMQKISKREKKFEKKLDAKLEKLESKTKKIMEKKAEMRGQKSAVQVGPEAGGSKRRQGVPVPEPIMDALPVDAYNHVLHVHMGEVVTQHWKVVNSGQLPWTNDTELRFAWGSTSLVPLATAVKCPLLQPGETGKIKVKLQAPMMAGNFECYWHFHERGRRFGHWLGCTVIVEAQDQCSAPSAPPLAPDLLDTAVDLTMKCSPPTLLAENTVESTEMKCGSSSEVIIEQNTWKDFPKSAQSPTFDLLNIKESPKSKSTPQVEDVKIENVTKSVANMTIYGVPEQWKNDVLPALEAELKEEEPLQTEPSSQTKSCEKQKETDEYNSASDSDNISVISGTVSIDSDTEPSEGFVVIPMPQCFNCEQALSEGGSVAQDVQSQPQSPLQESDNNNNMELKPYPQIEIFLPNVQDDTAQGQESGYSEGETEERIPEDDHDPNNVYVRDSQGRAIPVAKVLRSEGDENPGFTGPHGTSTNRSPFSVNVSVSHSTFGDPSVGHGPNGPRFPFGFGPDMLPPMPQCPNPPPPFRPNNRAGAKFCGGHPCPETNPFKNSCRCPLNGHGGPLFRHSSSGVRQEMRMPPGPQWSKPQQGARAPPIHTEQPRSCKYTRAPEPEVRPSTASRRSSSGESREASPVAAAAVQILPETLVTGAVNVASSAINTARTVIDMLIPRHDDGVPAAPHWDTSPQLEQALRQLQEMGFDNRELNLLLLRRYGNDVNRVISDLIQ